MAKRKKYPRLPSGYGSIKYLGKKRRNPYGVYPPSVMHDGKYVTPKAICYVDSWIKGFAVLTSYKAGTYTLGDERDINIKCGGDDVVQVLLANYNQLTNVDTKTEKGMTFTEVYSEFYHYKYEREGCRKYAAQTRKTTRAAYNNCKVLHDKTFADLRHDDLQDVIDKCKLGFVSLSSIVSLFNQMYEYAMAKDIISKNLNYSSAVKVNIEYDVEQGEPFTLDDLNLLWKNKENETVEMLLIMCYSGYRIGAYKDIEIHLKEKYFFGGVKGRGGEKKPRIVPIHSGIMPLVRKRLSRGALMPSCAATFRTRMYEVLEALGIERHTPHDCRHTFSMLCEKCKVTENDRKRLLGHSFVDVTNKVYGHRDIEDLRKEIEKIEICY